jgi:hypothetical protein
VQGQDGARRDSGEQPVPLRCHGLRIGLRQPMEFREPGGAEPRRTAGLSRLPSNSPQKLSEVMSVPLSRSWPQSVLGRSRIGASVISSARSPSGSVSPARILRIRASRPGQ